MKKIIPCLDIRGEKVVKGVKFEDVKDVGDPVSFAKNYIEQGADELVLYDISASIEKRTVPFELVKKIAELTKLSSIPFCVAGGISSAEDFQNALNAGADKVSINSPAVKNPALIKEVSEKFGRECVVVGIDAKRVETGRYTVTTGGGKIDAELDLIEWVKQVQTLGAGEICLNSIDADGVKDGYDIEMLNAVCEVATVPVIASGGCGKLEHFSEVFKKTKASAALAASVFHFRELTIGEIKEYLKEND
ncbi:MAG: imidazole glycerol phosphate synthase subunit HisF [Oscillospiraceae bacterium]|nr:imidazole glycerol phosphate synthase subunit HisF [Oscillospiraceae bacterium]